jgi:hypothetical protein
VQDGLSAAKPIIATPVTRGFTAFNPACALDLAQGAGPAGADHCAPKRGGAAMNKFPVLRFAVAAGLFLSLHAVIVTVSAMAGLPGMRPFAELLTQFYGPYGYSISAPGIAAGALLGFSEGFVHFGIFGLIYKWLPIRR